jgi:hypothetical protein
MGNFTTQVHVTGSARQFSEDEPYLRAIMQAVYDSHAIVFRNWLDAATSRSKNNARDQDTDWEAILNDNIEAIKKSDLVIVEATQARFSQGLQAYTAARYKKPTLIITRNPVKGHFISGVAGKLITIKEYSTEDELRATVAKFIKQNTIPEKDLRFNMILDRRIYKYLRDTSYETGKNKSQIVRELLEKDIERRK